MSDSGWRDIKTAPRDGTRFDAWCVSPQSHCNGVRFPDVHMRGDQSGFGFVIHTSKGTEWSYLERDDDIFPEWEPTHWMPLPEAPEEK